MSQFYVSVPEEFVSDPSVLNSSSGDAISQDTNADVSHHVAVLANSMLSELQRLATEYVIDPSEMSSLARLITSSLEELDVLVTENAAVEASANQARTDLDHVMQKLTVEQDLRQSCERRLWEAQDIADVERRNLTTQVQQMKASNSQLQERLKSKTQTAQALQDDFEELRKRQAEERQNHLEAIKRYMQQEKEHHGEDLHRSMTMGNAAVFAPTGTFRRRSSIRSSRSRRANTTSPLSIASPEMKSPPPPELLEEALVPACKEAEAGAEELRRLRRSETLSNSSAEWESTLGMTQSAAGDLSLQSELSMSDDSRPGSAANAIAYDGLENQSLLSDGDVDAVIDDVEQLAKDAAAVDQQRAQLAKENTDLKKVIDELTMSKEDAQQHVTLLQASTNQLESETKKLREDISSLKEQLATASRTAAVPDFSLQLRKENERLMKLYSFYKEKSQNLQKELSKQSEPLEEHSSLRRLFSRLLSGLRRGKREERSKLLTSSPPVSPISPSPDGSGSGHASVASLSSDDGSTMERRTPLRPAPPGSKRSPQSSKRSPTMKRGSLHGASLSSKVKSMTIAYRPRHQSSSEVCISFDNEAKPVVTSTGIFNPSGDWILGHDALRAVANEQMTLAACSSQAALFSSESSKIVCTTVTMCHGSPSTLDAPLIDLSSTLDDTGAVQDGPVCQQMWVCTKQTGSACQVEVLDIIGSGNLRHTGTIRELDACTRNDAILCMEFLPDSSMAGAFGRVASRQSVGSTPSDGSLATVWMGTDSDDGHLLIHQAKPGQHLGEKIQECHFGHGAVTCIRYAFQRAFIGFSNGLVMGFNRESGSQCGWHMVASDEDTLKLANLSAPSGSRQLNDISCMEAVETLLWCACGNYVFSVDPTTLTVVSCAKTAARHPISHMISVGCAVVLTTTHSSKIHFYHPSSAQLLQDFDTASLQEVVEQRTAQPAPGKLSAITSLAVCAGSLWIGTGTGVLLRLPVKTVLDTDSLQMALGSPACSYDWACVAQWCHWSAVRCLQVIRCNTSPEEAAAGTGTSWTVFSGGLGSLDFRSASEGELRNWAQFTSFATRHRLKTVTGADVLKQGTGGMPMFQQLLVWKS